MKQILYFECYSGISGDMVVAALLDLGADTQVLEKAINSLSLTGFHTKISRVMKAGLDACDFEVILDTDYENHDHDMSYLHNTCFQENTSLHGHTKETLSEQPHGHMHDLKHHTHRKLSDILTIIKRADITDNARQIATKIFTILGTAEANAHGTTLNEVHFHEVGAIDSIVDIIATAVCLDNLSITEVVIPFLYEGSGTIRCQHGILPIPVPAVTNIVQAYGLHLHFMDTQGEFVTPTGAAIAAAICTAKQLPERFRILRIGLGAGKREYERPSILRAMLLSPSTMSQGDIIYKLESNIDDCSGETMGYTMECLQKAGAKDVHYFPIFMKKNRPAYQLDVLCKEEDIPELEKIIFSQTTTIGIRIQRMERTILPRRTQSIQTPYGNVSVKICKLDGKIRIYPEYDSIVQICRQNNASYWEMYHLIQEFCHNRFS